MMTLKTLKACGHLGGKDIPKPQVNSEELPLLPAGYELAEETDDWYDKYQAGYDDSDVLLPRIYY